MNLTIEKVNPTLKLVYFNDASLIKKDVELTLARFNINSQGKYTLLEMIKLYLHHINWRGYSDYRNNHFGFSLSILYALFIYRLIQVNQLKS